MIAHGYGMAAQSSPKLMFSNILWGYFVGALPTVGGVLGYSLATLAVLFAVGAAIFYGMHRLGAGAPACLAMLALVMIRPILFPQFTVNAGLLLVAALVCWHVYARHNSPLALGAGCVLAFLSYLVRSHEFLLVFLVALPLIPWQPLWRKPVARGTFALLIGAIAISAIFDAGNYQGKEWEPFNQLNPARAAFTDFGAGEELKQHPDILKRHGFSVNDVDLVSTWFFVDTRIADPKLLRSMLGELGILPAGSNSWANAWLSLKSLWHPDIRPLLAIALILALLRPSYGIAASWLLFLAAIIIMGVLGRPGILRVYVPLLSLLAVAPFLSEKAFRPLRPLAALLVATAAAISASAATENSKNFELAAIETRREFTAFPAEPVVIWGDSFPFERIYPVLGASPAAMTYRLYGLGVFTWSPFSVAFAEQKRQRGVVDRLRQSAGMPFLATEERYEYLKKYCDEHHDGSLREISELTLGQQRISWRRCSEKISVPLSDSPPQKHEN